MILGKNKINNNIKKKKFKRQKSHGALRPVWPL